MSNINQLSLPTPFYSVLVSISVFLALSTVLHSINSPDNSLFSDCSSGLVSALLIHSTISLYEKKVFILVSISVHQATQAACTSVSSLFRVEVIWGVLQGGGGGGGGGGGA